MGLRIADCDENSQRFDLMWTNSAPTNKLNMIIFNAIYCDNTAWSVIATEALPLPAPGNDVFASAEYTGNTSEMDKSLFAVPVYRVINLMFLFLGGRWWSWETERRKTTTVFSSFLTWAIDYCLQPHNGPVSPYDWCSDAARFSFFVSWQWQSENQ